MTDNDPVCGSNMPGAPERGETVETPAGADAGAATRAKARARVKGWGKRRTGDRRRERMAGTRRPVEPPRGFRGSGTVDEPCGDLQSNGEAGGTSLSRFQCKDEAVAHRGLGRPGEREH